MKVILTLGLIVLSLVVFGQKKSKLVFPPPVLGMEYPEFISACELPSHKNELVYTRFIYSGVDEYWGLHPDKKCNQINADLNIPDDVVIRPGYIKQLKEVHENYTKKYLIIDVIGTFEDNKPSGYGHLGSNNSKFTVKYLVDLYTVNKSLNN
ncbi:MAG TPA: hypothetical protein VGN20_17840 [Mucilaginibacter sp.]|jgi:hypothetical protein